MGAGSEGTAQGPGQGDLPALPRAWVPDNTNPLPQRGDTKASPKRDSRACPVGPQGSNLHHRANMPGTNLTFPRAPSAGGRGGRIPSLPSRPFRPRGRPASEAGNEEEFAI